jgi:hypothetical protein
MFANVAGGLVSLEVDSQVGEFVQGPTKEADIVPAALEVPAGTFSRDDTKYIFEERLLHGIIQSRTSRFTMEVDVPGLGVRSYNPHE